MLKQACLVCKIVGVFAILGALNWGLIGLTNFNLVAAILGTGLLARILYIVIGISGVALLTSFFVICPKCKHS